MCTTSIEIELKKKNSLYHLCRDLVGKCPVIKFQNEITFTHHN